MRILRHAALYPRRAADGRLSGGLARLCFVQFRFGQPGSGHIRLRFLLDTVHLRQIGQRQRQLNPVDGAMNGS